MYADGNCKTIADLQYLVDLASETGDAKDRLTILKKAETLLHVIVVQTEDALYDD